MNEANNHPMIRKLAAEYIKAKQDRRDNSRKALTMCLLYLAAILGAAVLGVISTLTH